MLGGSTRDARPVVGSLSTLIDFHCSLGHVNPWERPSGHHTHEMRASAGLDSKWWSLVAPHNVLRQLRELGALLVRERVTRRCGQVLTDRTRRSRPQHREVRGPLPEEAGQKRLARRAVEPELGSARARTCEDVRFGGEAEGCARQLGLALASSSSATHFTYASPTLRM